MPIDRKAKVIFVHIPKTAGTSIELSLSLGGDWKEENGSTFFGQITSQPLLQKNLSSNFMQHLRLREIQNLLGDEFFDYEVFTVVRHPWTRLLSSFRRKDPDLCAYVRWRSRQDLEEASLSDYLKAASWVRHPHLNSQASFLKPSDPAMSIKDALKRIRVFKFEQLCLLEDWLSLKYQKPIQLSRHQVAVSPSPAISDDELMRLQRQCFELYERDYRLFGYTMNG
jgi:hypothetical protein